MKIRVMYGESFVTFCGYEDYVVDLDKFPELQGKSEEEITEWLYNNRSDVYINDSYVDPNPREEMRGAYEIVPEGEYTLADTVGNDGVTWDKIKNEEHYFVYIGEEEEEAEETESEEENGEEGGEEKESS